MIGVIRVPIIQRRIAWLVARRGASGSAVFGMRYADHSDRRNEKGNGDMADKEYIERGALLKRFAELHDGGNWLINDYNADWIRSFIETAPAADVVEVVRCKDCIYNNGACTHSEIYDDTNYNPDYYYADGERKEQT